MILHETSIAWFENTPTGAMMLFTNRSGNAGNESETAPESTLLLSSNSGCVSVASVWTRSLIVAGSQASQNRRRQTHRAHIRVEGSQRRVDFDFAKQHVFVANLIVEREPDAIDPAFHSQQAPRFVTV